jgi:hypothetical protein
MAIHIHESAEGTMKKLLFADIKQELLEVLEKLLQDTDIKEKVGLVDGFVNDPVSNELTDALVIGGPRVPMVMLVGEKTGRVYLFALKVLLPGRI